MSKSKKMRDHAVELADRLAPHVESARDKAAPYVADARKRAKPALTDAKGRLNNDVLPAISAAISAAGDATEDVRGEAARRGRATAAALMGEVEAPAKKHRLRKLLVVLGLGGVAAFVAKKMSDRKPSTAWQSSYTPPPAPTAPAGSAAATAAGTTDDEGGSAPDVIAADAAAEPHAATTPDNPAEEIHLKTD